MLTNSSVATNVSEYKIYRFCASPQKYHVKLVPAKNSHLKEIIQEYIIPPRGEYYRTLAKKGPWAVHLTLN
jgi:uncharacterized protein YcgI (DUF1989 family)